MMSNMYEFYLFYFTNTIIINPYFENMHTNKVFNSELNIYRMFALYLYNNLLIILNINNEGAFFNS